MRQNRLLIKVRQSRLVLNTPQRKWLERIGQQLKIEQIVDREALEKGAFKAEGGFNRINKVFDGKLQTILEDISEAIWKQAA